MRLQDESIPGELNLHSYVQDKQTESIFLKDASSLYLNQKGKNRSITFRRGVERALGYVIHISGNKRIEQYNRTDANRLMANKLEVVPNATVSTIIKCGKIFFKQLHQSPSKSMQGMAFVILKIRFIGIKNSNGIRKTMFFDLSTLRHYDTFGENYIGV